MRSVRSRSTATSPYPNVASSRDSVGFDTFFAFVNASGRASGHGRGDPLHPFEHLQAALRRARLGGLRAEAVHERLDPPDLQLLLRMPRRLQRQRLGELAFEGRVAHRCRAWSCRRPHGRSRRRRRRGNPVVRNDEQRADIASEPGLEPQRRIEIEMVGRLVEQQEIRRRHQGAREVQPNAPSAGELPVRFSRSPRPRSEPCRISPARASAS